MEKTESIGLLWLESKTDQFNEKIQEVSMSFLLKNLSGR